VIYRLISAALLFFAFAVSIAEGHPLPMWQIDGETNRIYLLGSVHLLREQDHPIPDAIYTAYDEVDLLVMELDMDDIDPIATQTMINDLGMIKGGESLSDLMGADLYGEAEQIAEQINIPLAMLTKTEPWLAAINIEQLILMRIGFNPMYGIESHLTSKATADSKEILGLESIDQQLGFLDGMSLEAQRTLLMQTLGESLELEDIMDELITAWRNGDIDYLEKSMLVEMQEYPELYEALVVSRNENWAGRIEEMLRDDQDYLIVVGALHLIGDDGLPSLLLSRGYSPVQMRQE
jgi:uncharacterized protein YbaP (TraB family)